MATRRRRRFTADFKKRVALEGVAGDRQSQSRVLEAAGRSALRFDGAGGA